MDRKQRQKSETETGNAGRKEKGMRTVGEVSKLTGLSIRTLRYYGQAGLLEPAGWSKTGYRLYDEGSLETLRQILFFRELDIPIKDMKQIFAAQGAARERLLDVWKTVLERRRDRTNGLIELIEDVRKGVGNMGFERFKEEDVQKMVEGMKAKLSPEEFEKMARQFGGGSLEGMVRSFTGHLNREEHRMLLQKWYGGRENVVASALEPAEDMERHREEIKNIYAGLLRIKDAGDGAAGKALAARPFFLLSRIPAKACPPAPSL